MKTKISIVLPTYNGEQYLAEAIESCLSQTFDDWELIIVDDCSTDSTPDIIQHYVAKDSRMDVIRHETNRKLPAALNTGFHRAQGEYHTWISDDNYYQPRALEAMSRYLDEHQDVDIVYTDAEIVDEAGSTLRIREVDPPIQMNQRNVIGWSFMYREQVFHRINGYDEDCFMAEDYDFWLRALRYFKASALHENLFVYRQHGRSLTGTRAVECKLASARMLLRNVPHLTWAPAREKALTYYECAGLFRRNGFYAQTARAWVMALLTAPAFTLKRATAYLRKS